MELTVESLEKTLLQCAGLFVEEVQQLNLFILLKLVSAGLALSDFDTSAEQAIQSDRERIRSTGPLEFHKVGSVAGIELDGVLTIAPLECGIEGLTDVHNHPLLGAEELLTALQKELKERTATGNLVNRCITDVLIECDLTKAGKILRRNSHRGLQKRKLRKPLSLCRLQSRAIF